MAFRFIVALAFVAVASAGVLQAPQDYHGASYGFAQPILTKSVESYDPHPRYQFSYSVNDEHTGDVKSQSETRDGDLVQGEYSLIDADGYKRTVQYTADHDHGFNAVVHREPLGYAVKTAPVVKAAQVAYAAPALIKSSPLAYAAAPTVIKSAPLAYASAPAAYTSQAILKSSPVSYAAAAAPSLNYASAPAAYTSQSIVKSSPVSYAAAAPSLNYASAPAAYTSQSIVKYSPVSYAAAAPSLNYASAPAAYATQLISKNSHESYVDLPYSYEH